MSEKEIYMRDALDVLGLFWEVVSALPPFSSLSARFTRRLSLSPSSATISRILTSSVPAPHVSAARSNLRHKAASSVVFLSPNIFTFLVFDNRSVDR